MGEQNRGQLHTSTSTASLASSTSSSPPSTPTANGLRHASSTSSLSGSAGPASLHGGGHDDFPHAASYRARPSRFLKLVNWWHLISVYFPAILYALVAVLVAQLFVDVNDHGREIKVRLSTHPPTHPSSSIHPSIHPYRSHPSTPPSSTLLLPRRNSCTWWKASRPSASPSS